MNQLLESKFLYLGLMILSMAYPLAQSFEWRLKYYKKWKYLIPGILVMMLFFIPWDIYFTMKGVWWFNDAYTMGIRIFHLPVEEWMFFMIVPFACVFIYEVLIYFIKKDPLIKYARFVFVLILVILLVLAMVYFNRIYTFTTFSITALSLLILIYFNPHWIGRFLMMYLVSLIPFLIINGILTGSLISGAIVNYDSASFMGFRIFTIPVEDSIYSLLMLLIVVSIYEWLKVKLNERAQ